ncbi:hypothetical protein ACWD9K_34595 [Streptomyces sp. 900116325]
MVDQAKSQVTPCASNHGAPPTPPYREEEGSSSLKSSSITPGASATAVAAAAEFLAELPGRWACGRKSAAELAPLLADAVQEQGWKLSGELVQQLTLRSQARRGALSVLRERIEDLPRYRAARVAAGRVPEQPLALKTSEHGYNGTAPQPDGVSAERVDKAREFLLTLTGPWALGPESAVRLAPLLAAKTAERGWEFDARLLAQLQSNPNGVNNYELVLEKHRITGLPFRRSTVNGQRRDTQDTRQKAIEACGTCDAYGQFERDGAAVLCKHDRPSAAAAPKAAGPRASSGTSSAAADAAPANESVDRNLVSLLTSMRQPSI